jgi:hypothetical protein
MYLCMYDTFVSMYDTYVCRQQGEEGVKPRADPEPKQRGLGCRGRRKRRGGSAAIKINLRHLVEDSRRIGAP